MTDWKQHNDLIRATLHPVTAARALCFENDMLGQGLPIFLIYGYRSSVEQDLIWAKGRSIKSDVCCTHHGVSRPVGTCPEHPLGATVTNCRGGFSAHQFWYPFDAAPDNPNMSGLQLDWNPTHPVWRTMLATAKKYHLAEGAEWRTFKDFPHFYPEELPANPPAELRDIVNRGGKEAVFKWIDARISPREVAAAQSGVTH